MGGLRAAAAFAGGRFGRMGREEFLFPVGRARPTATAALSGVAVPGGLDCSRRFGDNLSMTAEQVREAREKAPFTAFTIYLSDQRRCEIPHPDFVWVMPGGRTIGIAHENGAAEIDDLVHVTSLKLNGIEAA
jgi:hypothetical protein